MNELIIKKLRLNSYKNISIIKKSKDKKTIFDKYKFKLDKSEKLDLAIAYVYTLEEMKKIIINSYKTEKIRESGSLYLIYPKNKNKLEYIPIHRDSIFPYLEVNEEDGYVKNTQYKFNMMVSLDENYTLIGLKYLLKTKNKKIKKISSIEYVEKIIDIENYLKNFEEEYEFFKEIAQGYKKNWAVYIYSAKTEKTIQKRLEEMKKILKNKYKSKQLYQKDKNK